MINKILPFVPFVGFVYLLKYTIDNKFESLPTGLDSTFAMIASATIQSSSIMILIGLIYG
jgi:hypothetical protein